MMRREEENVSQWLLDTVVMESHVARPGCSAQKLSHLFLLKERERKGEGGREEERETEKHRDRERELAK